MKKYLAMAFIILLGLSSYAREYEGVQFPETNEVLGKKMELNGIGMRYARRFFMNFKVYAAGLYLEKKSQNPEEIMKSHRYKKLVMHFFRDVSKEKLIKAYRGGLKDNGIDLKKYKKEIADLVARMPSVKEGEKIVFIFFKNYFEIQYGKTKYQVMGREFLEYVLKLWLGHAPNKELKAGILGIKNSDN